MAQTTLDIDSAVDSLVEAIEGVLSDSKLWILPSEASVEERIPAPSGSMAVATTLPAPEEQSDINEALLGQKPLWKLIAWEALAGSLVVLSIVVALAILG